MATLLFVDGMNLEHSSKHDTEYISDPKTGSSNTEHFSKLSVEGIARQNAGWYKDVQTY